MVIICYLIVVLLPVVREFINKNNNMEDNNLSRTEKIEKIQKIEKEIKELSRFFSMLQDVATRNTNKPKIKIKKNVEYSFLGLRLDSIEVEIDIPEKMIIEVAAKTKKWIDHLEKQSTELLSS
jgi:hypothetical protein